MNMTNLIAKWNNYNETNENALNMTELQFLLENEDHEVFSFDCGLYRDIMDYRDYLCEETE